jgi:hypothetical protein
MPRGLDSVNHHLFHGCRLLKSHKRCYHCTRSGKITTRSKSHLWFNLSKGPSCLPRLNNNHHNSNNTSKASKSTHHFSNLCHHPNISQHTTCNSNTLLTMSNRHSPKKGEDSDSSFNDKPFTAGKCAISNNLPPPLCLSLSHISSPLVSLLIKPL